jgi:hypothetical protein
MFDARTHPQEKMDAKYSWLHDTAAGYAVGRQSRPSKAMMQKVAPA